MPTVITKTIGATSSPVTPDYTTLQAAEDAVTVGLVAADEQWDLLCLDQGTFTAGAIIAGQTVDATRYIRLACAAGASFKDKAGVRTTALRYNTANGVTIEVASVFAVDAQTQYTRVEGLQMRRTGYYNAYKQAANCLVDSCIAKDGDRDGGENYNMASGSKAVNCLAERAFSGSAFHGQGDVFGCTAICTDATPSSAAFSSAYSNLLVKNSAAFGFSSFVTGTLKAGTDYNATDNASIPVGSNNLTSLTFADQFENSANDFRAKSSGSLDLSGTPDTTNTPDDISGTTRHATTPTIGCWEVVAAAGTTRGMPFGNRSTAFNGGRTLAGPLC